MQALSQTFNVRPVRLLTATLVLALAAGFGQAAMARPQGPGPGGPGMAFMDGRHMDHALESVGATTEQRAQIKQIFQSARSDLKAQHESGRQLHQQMQALFAAPTVDARAAEALRAQISAQHDAASKRMLQAMIDASRVLSADQRKALSDRMAQRGAMMERHRAEREAAGATPSK